VAKFANVKNVNLPIPFFPCIADNCLSHPPFLIFSESKIGSNLIFYSLRILKIFFNIIFHSLLSGWVLFKNIMVENENLGLSTVLNILSNICTKVMMLFVN